MIFQKQLPVNLKYLNHKRLSFCFAAFPEVKPVQSFNSYLGVSILLCVNYHEKARIYEGVYEKNTLKSKNSRRRTYNLLKETEKLKHPVKNQRFSIVKHSVIFESVPE